MSRGKAWRLGGFIAALAASAGLVAAASGTTGAYFNETKSGTVDGTIGSIHVTTSGGTGTDNLDFMFHNLLPGSPQTATVGFTNTGFNAEDVYLVFNNKWALHALNNMGRYGEVTVASNRLAGTQDGYLFESSNLNDSLDANLALDTNCPLPTSFPGNETEQDAINAVLSGGVNPCWPVPNVIKIASNLAPNAAGTLAFSFGLGAKAGSGGHVGSEGAPHMLCYPLVQDPTSTNLASQICGSSPSYGLPYQIVATQVGIAPNNPLNSFPTP